MSKELLKKVRDTLHGLEETHYDLYWDIQAELNKHEQQLDAVLKLRNLRDIQGKKGNHDYDEYMRGLYNGLELALSLFEDEREPQYKNPLAQPEQPPMTQREMYQRGYAKAEKDLKREPLSDERLEFLVDKHHGYPKTLGREIEKEHGIEGKK
jgi:hypothetical protein